MNFRSLLSTFATVEKFSMHSLNEWTNYLKTTGFHFSPANNHRSKVIAWRRFMVVNDCLWMVEPMVRLTWHRDNSWSRCRLDATVFFPFLLCFLYFFAQWCGED
jgi:hypothetical protein